MKLVKRMAWRERQRQGLLRSWQPGGSHDLRFRHKPVDADTLRKREQFDRKGSHAFRVVIGGREFEVYHSTAHAQRYDIFRAGYKLATRRLGLVLETIANLSAA